MNNHQNSDFSKDYNDMVAEFIKENSSIVFGNLTTTHASLIIKSLIEVANHSIEILSGNFNDTFYDGIAIYKTLKDAARRINQEEAIRIVTLDGIKDSETKIMRETKKINKELGKNVIKYIPARYTGNTPVEHFLLVDNMRYRIEEPHLPTKGPIEETKAAVCCNDKEKTLKKLDFFNLIWSKLTTAE